MHFEFLVEDKSGGKALDNLVPKIIGEEHTVRIIDYRGLGDIPKGLTKTDDVKNRQLLNNLPKLLGGYGKTYGYSSCPKVAVIVVCDLDDRCLKSFREQLFGILNSCVLKPETRFCIAIEEVEAWFLGDIPAIKSAYPEADDNVLNRYKNDEICGTSEVLAEALHSKKLKKKGSSSTGEVSTKTLRLEKSQWAKKITPYMDVENNKSPSFKYFKKKLRELAGIDDRSDGIPY